MTTTTPILRTASYAVASRCALTVVGTSVSSPRWLGALPQLHDARPFGIFGQELEWADYSERYVQRLTDRWDRIERDLHRLTAEHGSIALCCWCRDPARCHRSLLGEFLTHRLGIDVPELETEPAHNTPSL